MSLLDGSKKYNRCQIALLMTDHDLSEDHKDDISAAFSML